MTLGHLGKEGNISKCANTFLIQPLNPIFHRKLGSRWVTISNEIDINIMKCTWPMRAPTRGDPTQPIFHLFTLGSHWARVGSVGALVWSGGLRIGSARLFGYRSTRVGG